LTDSHDLIDACIAYVESKDAHYLAKEGYAVYYTSPTGRKAGYSWQRITITEMLRVIRAIRLSIDQSTKLKEPHLVAAFQELGRVYEYAVRTRHKVEEGIFNYLEHCESSLGDEAMSLLSAEMVSRGYKGLVLTEILGIFMQIQTKLDIGVTLPQARELLCKHFEMLGYEIKAGSRRPLVRGRKIPALMLGGARPRDVFEIGELETGLICSKIVGVLL